MIEDDYFIPLRENNNFYPLFDFQQGSLQFFLDEPLDIQSPVQLTLVEPVPKNFQFADFHPCPLPVFSKRVIEDLLLNPPQGTQFFPTLLNHSAIDETMTDYYLWHIYNHQSGCIDREKSDFNRKYSTELSINGIKKIVLDAQLISNLEDSLKLAIVIEENAAIHLLHHTVVKKILQNKPTGIRFVPVAEYSENLMFQ